jgi:hypothetical protein
MEAGMIAAIIGIAIVLVLMIVFSPELRADPSKYSSFEDVILEKQKESESSVKPLFGHKFMHIGTNFVTWKESDGSDLIRCLACRATWSTGTVSTNIVHLARHHKCHRVDTEVVTLPASPVPVGRKFR